MPSGTVEQGMRQANAPACSPSWVRDFIGTTTSGCQGPEPELSPRLPTDVFQIIVNILHDIGALGTLVNLLCVKHLREVAAQKLYGTLRITARTFARLLVGLPRWAADESRLVQRPDRSLHDFSNLGSPSPCPVDDDAQAPLPAPDTEEISSIAERLRALARPDRASRRKLLLFSLTRLVIIDDVPYWFDCADLCNACRALEPALLLPIASGVQLGPGAIDTLRLWGRANSGMRHPLLAGLQLMMRPHTMCVDCRETETEVKSMEDSPASEIARWEGIERLYKSTVEWYDGWQRARADPTSDDLPHWDSLYSATFHHVEFPIIRYYAAPRVDVHFSYPAYGNPLVVRMLATMLGDPPPSGSSGSRAEETETSRHVSMLSAHFPVVEGTKGEDRPGVAWNEKLSRRIQEDIAGRKPDDLSDQSKEAIRKDVLRRFAVVRREEGRACCCCGSK